MAFILSQCDPKTQFTCWNGECISIDKRCDGKIDCCGCSREGQDEKECKIFQTDKKMYKNDLVPVNHPTKDKLKVDIHVHLFKIQEINQAKVISNWKMLIISAIQFSHQFQNTILIFFSNTSKFSLISCWYLWKDQRIEYLNLKDSYKDNILSDTEAEEIWKPKLILKNSLERIELKYGVRLIIALG